MKRYLYILVFFIPFFSTAQSKYTAAQVEKSTDPQVIANFIKYFHSFIFYYFHSSNCSQAEFC